LVDALVVREGRTGDDVFFPVAIEIADRNTPAEERLD
jgi:hypothetical protein